MKTILLLLLLLPTSKAFCQAIAHGPTRATALTPLSETVCLPASQARIIAQALQRFEKLKPAYLQQVKATQGWREVHGQDSTIAAGQVRLIDWYKVTYAEEQSLRQDANKKLALSQGKAKRRGLLVAIETAALALAGYALITK